MMQGMIKLAVAGAVVLLAAGCASRGGQAVQASADAPQVIRLGAGDTVGNQLYKPVTGMFAVRTALRDVSLAGVNQDE